MKKRIALFLAILALAVPLSGCQALEGKTAEGYAKQINFFQWTEYTPQSVLDGFKQKYGITVKMTTFSSGEEMVSKLKAGGLSQYDVTVPSSYLVKSMIAQNLIEPFDPANVPNISNIDPSCLKKSYDPNNTYTVPYMLSPCVLVVNTKKVTKPISSFNDLTDSAFKNQIIVVDDERPIIGVALKSLGFSCNDTNKDHLNQALTWLKKLKPNIKAFDSDSPKTSLISGECTIGYIYNGEAAQAIKENTDLKVVWTSEGLSGLIIDNLALVKGTKHKKEAEMFINYILEANTSKLITTEYPYTNPNNAAHSLLGDSYLNNSAINIPWDKLASGELIDDVGDSLPQFDDIWSAFKS
jgi:spermidine/putrescine-binding protein